VRERDDELHVLHPIFGTAPVGAEGNRGSSGEKEAIDMKRRIFKKETNMKRISVYGFMVVVLCSLPVAGYAQNQLLVSQQGGLCLDAEGGIRDGAKVLSYPCNNGPNEHWSLERGRLVANGGQYCAQAEGRNPTATIVLKACNWSDSGNYLQNFARWPGNRIGHNSGNVIQNGFGWGARPVMLGAPNGGETWKQWRWGTMQQAAQARPGQDYMLPNRQGVFHFSGGKLIGNDGGTLVATGGGNIVAAGGGN
jgi:hypothetical protein